MRGPPWPERLLSFDPADWRGPADEATVEAAGYSAGTVADERVMEAVALWRWSSARAAFAESHGLEYVVTLIAGRCYRRAAFLDAIVTDPRERQTAWDTPA
jgi:hypothetical protein